MSKFTNNMSFTEKTIYKQKHTTQITKCLETFLKCDKTDVLYTKHLKAF